MATDTTQISKTQNTPVKILLETDPGGDDIFALLLGSLAKRQLTEACFADNIIIEKLNATPGQITLIAVAPLTNLAAAENKSPGILTKAKEVIIMGDIFLYNGNVTSHAEFNIYSNPKSCLNRVC